MNTHNHAKSVPKDQMVGQVRLSSQGVQRQSFERHTREATNDLSDKIPDKLTRQPGLMTRKRKRRSSVVEIGNGPAMVRIYTMHRKDGYNEFTLAWKEGGKRRLRSFSCMDEAKMVAQQITVKLANGWIIGSEATKRDLELLWYCERLAARFGVTLAAAIDEWVSARSVVVGITLSDAVRFYQSHRDDLNTVRTVAQVADEFVKSRAASGVSLAYVNGCQDTLRRFCEKVNGNIGDVKTADINNYLSGMKGLGPVSRNCHRRNIVTMFSFAKKQGYLHQDRKTVAERS